MDRVQLLIAELQQHVSILHLHIIVSAVFPIYTSAHASLSRPSSAAKAIQQVSDAHINEEEDDDDDEEVHEMESLSATDAILFPILAGCVLVFLCYLIQRYGADIINKILAWYFAGVVISSTGKIFSDGVELILSFAFPTYYKDHGHIWRLQGQAYQTIDGKITEQRSSPLPGTFHRIQLGNRLTAQLWQALNALKQKYVLDAYVRAILEIHARFTVINFTSALASIAVVAYSNFIDKPWWLTNVQGFAVSYFGMQFLSPSSFTIGSLVLGGLFFYDIWAVFFTEYMVFAATKLDQPVKLMFPRPEQEDDSAMSYSMLGLGDIVLPGLMLGLALRFDLYMFYLRKQVKLVDGEIQKAAYTSVKGLWGSSFWTTWTTKALLPLKLQNAAFPKPYFTASLIGYISGMILTLEVMTYFQHAQPALLYLVPSVLLSIWGTALVRGELKEMIAYSEGITGEAIDSKEPNASAKSDKNEQVISPGVGEKHSEVDQLRTKKSSEADTDFKSKHEATFGDDIFVHFSVKKHTRAAKMVVHDKNDTTAKSLATQ